MEAMMEQYKDLQIVSYDEITEASNTFHKDNYLGGGGFGNVYKGELSRFKERGMVAFKRLDRQYGQGETEFLKEVSMLSKYKHENLITLLGYCIKDKEMILVYEYAAHGSLDFHLGSRDFTWTQRLKICLQAAEGLRFLHDPNGAHHNVIHRDIKSGNILLDDKWNAKIADVGLSKISPENANLVTVVRGTPGYTDPQYHQTYTLTDKSDVYSFGVTLFEVLCGSLCYEIISENKVLVFVRKWKKSYQENKLKEIIFKELSIEQMDQSSVKLFSDIAYKCLNESREDRPTMAEVVSQLEVALQSQEDYDVILSIPLPKVYKEIVRVAVSRVSYSSIEELKERLSEGVLINGGKAWASINEKEESCVLISIEECLIQDDPNTSCNDNFLLQKDSRFPVRCYKTDKMNFKLCIRTPLFLSPDVTYRLNLVFHCCDSERGKMKHVGIRYKFQGETKISVVRFEDRKEYKRLVAGLYHFNSTTECISDFEILFEDCGFSGDLYIEGIEFQPLKNVERPVVVVNKEIDRAVASPLFYGFAEEPEVLFSQGVLLNKGKLWFSINDEEQHCLMLSIEDCLIHDDPKRDYSDEYLSEKNSRFVAGCYKAHMMKFKIRVITPFFLSPDVTYRVNVVFKYSDIEQMKQQSFHVMYKLLGETEIWMVNVGDWREDGWLVAELYHFTNEGEKSILDLEIIFEDCGLSGYFYIEGIEFQPVEQPVAVVEYKEILKHGVTPLFYRCTEKLRLLLTRGILHNRGKTLFCLNDKGEHIERIFIEACLNDGARLVKHRDDCVNSRFPGGRCYEYEWSFNARVRSQYLTPRISYAVNIVLRYKHEYNIKFYGPMRYKINGEDETKVFIIYPTDMRQDGWFVVPLYHFTSKHTTADIQFEFESRTTNMNLLVAGFEFQPSEEKVELQVFEEYQHIVEVSSQSLFYRSLDELKQIFSKGVHLNGYKTFFSLNEKQEHCHMISMKDCLIPNEDIPSQYESDSRSRFPAGLYQTNNKGFKTHVKTHFLSPLITYTVNLVFDSSSYDEQAYVDLKYRLRGETTTFTVSLAKNTDRCLYMAELYQFTSDGSIFDLEIMFEDCETNIRVEGILFQPLEIVDPLLKDDKSDSGILKKNLFSSIGKWFLFNNDTTENDTVQEWASFEEKEKKCVMLSARVVCFTTEGHFTWRFLSGLRFGEVLVITAGDKFELVNEIKPEALSNYTTYASYFVYKLPSEQSKFESPLEVCYKSDEYYFQYTYSYLVTPPNTPVIGQKFDENYYNPLNRHRLSSLPRQRSDGWMEVKVWEFDTRSTPTTVSMHLKLEHPVKKDLSGLIILGIELRPIHWC